MSFRRLWNIFILCAISASCFVFIEWGARHWVRRMGDPLQRARLILIPDSEWMWRQRANLSTWFEGFLVRTDSLGFRNDRRLESLEYLVLGPSSAFGWGVAQEKTYAALLSSASWNGGQIGYSLLQGRKVYEYLKKRSNVPLASKVVLAYGINDIDQFRFFGEHGRNDLRGAEEAAVAFNGFDWLNRFALFGIVQRAWEESALYRNCGLSRAPVLRVPFEVFENELLAFIKQLKADGSEVVLMTTPFHSKGNFSPGDAQRSEALYRESYEASKRGRCAESRRRLGEARALETARVLRDVTRVNRIIRKISFVEHVSLVDAAILLQGEPENFVDPVHPSAKGHEILAAAIRNSVTQQNKLVTLTLSNERTSK